MRGSTILWIIIIGAFFYWMMRRGGCGMGHGGHSGKASEGGEGGHQGQGAGSKGGSPMVKDEVCGMFVDPQSSVNSEHMGKTFYFCSSACKEKFDKEPMSYMKNMKKETKRGGCCG